MTFAFRDSEPKFHAVGHNILYQCGISVNVGTDFRTYRDIVVHERSHQIMALPFEPEILERSSDDAFWMTARNADGNLIHTQAARIVDMGGQCFSDYMVRGFRLFPPPLTDLDAEKSRFRPSPGARRISGKVVYHGDVWMGGAPSEFRGTGLSTVLARLALREIMDAWDPDYIFGLMARTVACKGFAERMGYMHNEPGAVMWYRMGHAKALEGFLSYLSREDTDYVLSMPLPDLFQRADAA